MKVGNTGLYMEAATHRGESMRNLIVKCKIVEIGKERLRVEREDGGVLWIPKGIFALRYMAIPANMELTGAAPTEGGKSND